MILAFRSNFLVCVGLGFVEFGCFAVLLIGEFVDFVDFREFGVYCFVI